jgi:NTP pyrophosphatase (non-canonical NTP hydrolase)
MELLTKVQRVAQVQTKRFPNGNDPYKIGCRILEEAGETIQQLNHYERWGVSVGEKSKEGKENLVKEAYQVFVALNQLMQYFDLSADLENHINDVYQEFIDRKFLSKDGEVTI